MASSAPHLNPSSTHLYFSCHSNKTEKQKLTIILCSLLSLLRQEMDELRAELARKDALIQRHMEKLNQWHQKIENPQPGPHQQQQPQQQQHQAPHGMQQQGRPQQMGPRGGAAGPMVMQGMMGPYGGQPSVPLSGPLAHLEHAASNIGGFDRR